MSNDSISYSLDPCKDYSSNHRLHLVGYSLIFVAGLMLNAMALWVFLRYLHLKSVVSIYMFNLAVSDLLFTLSLPLRLYYYSSQHWPFGNFLCQVSGSLFQINMYGSCLFLMCISLDRYVAIVHPLRWRHLRRPKVARLLCLVVWVLILVGSVPAAGVHRSSSCIKGNQTISLCFESFSDGLWQKGIFPLVILAEILGFLLPLTSVTYCSIRIFQKLCQASETQSLRQQKTIRLLVVNLVIFIICFVPYNTTLAAYGMIKAHVIQAEPPVRDAVRQALIVTVLLASMNCSLDPLIYYFSTEGFRNTFKKLRRGQAWDSDTGMAKTQVTETKCYRARSSLEAKRYPVQNFILPNKDLPLAPIKIFLNGPIEDSEI
ncbi:lysophosphatidic acid receptor 5 [Mauremys reevesii]|uniref:lysophosphatidic acid receptor 5 n=1 Tax=Mauremys reevesii TaxID=260615 RepID=UPI00193F3F45|nr:lysophosphatidic acid receptor 5 [Mauremys reevesii]XP_039376491.1 lysophosphatidic acid receptor 5 [Mauremys reevesii]XP_039376492.1 lysophosphatidic acid receptor 5 [Mauremys reevesii]XP_039376493.1 lysophosphatidic acid receptor 5 [Mauremys reevesii]XP_039376494.1 lysophosphatidic acid receptor 5 [Mauremys reevesii]XP_039376495.1 lysophosphatidic acid receptor 5 [Mauremys reevesii]